MVVQPEPAFLHLVFVPFHLICFVYVHSISSICFRCTLVFYDPRFSTMSVAIMSGNVLSILVLSNA